MGSDLALKVIPITIQHYNVTPLHHSVTYVCVLPRSKTIAIVDDGGLTANHHKTLHSRITYTYLIYTRQHYINITLHIFIITYTLYSQHYIYTTSYINITLYIFIITYISYTYTSTLHIYNILHQHHLIHLHHYIHILYIHVNITYIHYHVTYIHYHTITLHSYYIIIILTSIYTKTLFSQITYSHSHK